MFQNANELQYQEKRKKKSMFSQVGDEPKGAIILSH
jgi:superfamily II DNA/RNA helicase